MGRNKFSEKEIKAISKLLELKNKSNRAKQKEIRHELRTKYEFNISDFNVQGQAFGAAELNEALKRRAIIILDDATIANMLEKRARDKARDAELQRQNAEPLSEGADWEKALKAWNDWEKTQENEENAGKSKEND